MKADEVHLLSLRVASLTGLRSLLLLGSQSIHAYTGQVPGVVLRSLEADYLLPEDAPPEAASQIELELGRDSSFHHEHGFYADVAVYGLALLPPRWHERLKVERLAADQSLSLHSLEPHDLAVSKLCADRPKDIEFLADALEGSIITLPVLAERIAEFGDDLRLRALLGARLQLLPPRIIALRAEQEESRQAESHFTVSSDFDSPYSL